MQAINPLLRDIRDNRLLWLLALVPVLFAAKAFKPEAHALLFVLSVLAIVPLAALLSHATESVAAKTGDTIGGLLNATLGNLTELIIALTALRAGQYVLVKASIAGAIVTNTLFMLGVSLLLGGLKHHVQEYNRNNARLQAGLLFLATIALLIPSVLAEADPATPEVHPDAEPGAVRAAHRFICVGNAVLAQDTSRIFWRRQTWRERRSIVADGTRFEHSGRRDRACRTRERGVRRIRTARGEAFGMTPAFVGFIIVALVGGAAEMVSAFSGARKNRLDLSVGIALGSASQIALFVAPVLVLLSYVMGPAPMNLQFWPGAIAMMLIATMTAALVTNSGRSAWFVGVLVVNVYLVFAMTLYLLPPQVK